MRVGVTFEINNFIVNESNKYFAILQFYFYCDIIKMWFEKEPKMEDILRNFTMRGINSAG